MTEIVKGDLTREQAKSIPDIQTLIDTATSDGKLNEAEGMEILIRLKTWKEQIFQNTKNKLDELAAFLEEGDNGRNWKSLKDILKVAPIADGVQNSMPNAQLLSHELTVKDKQNQMPMTAKEIQTKIDDIEKIISDGIAFWEPEELTHIIRDLQDSKVLNKIPGIGADGKIEAWKDVIEVAENVIERLEKIRDSKEDEKPEKVKPVESMEQQTGMGVEPEKIGEEEKKSQFLKQLSRMKMDWLDVNASIDEKITTLQKGIDTDEDRVIFAENVKPVLNDLKMGKGEKTFSDLVSDVELKGNTLSFHVDPDWWDNYDKSDKQRYTVTLPQASDLQNPENFQVIRDKVKEAYMTQIDHKVKDSPKTAE